jgi:hypothetical protein
MKARKEIKEKLMKAKAQHYSQVSSESIGKRRHPDNKTRPAWLSQLVNHESRRVFPPTTAFPGDGEAAEQSQESSHCSSQEPRYVGRTFRAEKAKRKPGWLDISLWILVIVSWCVYSYLAFSVH